MAAITERRLNLLSWIFFWLGPLDSGVDERTNVKEKSREQELTGTEVARKIAKESGRMAFWKFWWFCYKGGKFDISLLGVQNEVYKVSFNKVYCNSSADSAVKKCCKFYDISRFDKSALWRRIGRKNTQHFLNNHYFKPSSPYKLRTDRRFFFKF